MIKVSHLTHIYDKRKTDGITDLNFEIPENAIVSLVGPSGSGKTTTLKCMAGLISDFSGEIEMSKREIISYVDQIPSLQIDESVFANLISATSDIQDEQKQENQIRMTLSQLDLTNEINTLVSDLSGGQRQRITLAKSLVKNPTVLMLDEPFANLDKSLRLQLFNELFPILKDQGITLIWVTHNQEEALRYSDKMVLLNYGKIEQQGTPFELYFKPESLFTAKFFGETNISIGEVKSISESTFEHTFMGEIFNSPIPSQFDLKNVQDLLITIKPEFIHLTQDSDSLSEVTQEYFLGSSKLLKIKTEFGEYWSKTTGNSSISEGDKVRIEIDPINFQFLEEV